MALENKEYLYSFIGGGWNWESAKTKREAIAQAKKRWAGISNLQVDTTSFRISTPRDYQNLMSLFY